jgi:hypothetical protein
MTNTLHRYGSKESFRDDYVVFARTTRGKNDQNCVPRLKRFLELALQFGPVNLGDSVHGGALRPSQHLTPRAHWKRNLKPDFRAVIDGIDGPTNAVAVFDDFNAAANFLKAVKEADLGLCVNMSTSVEGALRCSCTAGQPRHSVSYSLGFEGETERMPNGQVVTLTTMCGHGMVSSSLAKKMIDWVKEGRRTPEEAAQYLTHFCSCGVYNPSRAKRVLEEAKHHME